MTQHSSTSIPTSAVALPATKSVSARSLRWRLVAGVGLGAVAVLGAVAYAGLFVLRTSMNDDADARLLNAASLSRQLVERVLVERSRQVDLIASAPSVIDAARKGAEVSRQKGLPPKSIPELENMFRATRSQQVDDAARLFLNDLLAKLDIAEVMVTDQYGFNAVTTSPSSDFVQSDESWWQSAWNHGATAAQATADPATKRTVVELAAPISDHGTELGVVKVKFGLAVVDSVLAQGSTGTGALRVELIDSNGRVIATSSGLQRFQPFGSLASMQNREGTSTVNYYTADSTLQRAALAATNSGRWRIVAHMGEDDATHAYTVARRSLVAGLLVVLGLIIASLVFIARFIERRITGPAEELAIAAEAVAAGDLSVRVNDIGSNDEIGRLAHAIAGMIEELRRLAIALNESTRETTSMTVEITASTEEMAAAAGEMAHTASDLSQQANVMAETIQTLVASSEDLVGIAADIETGANNAGIRNQKLRALAADNRGRLDDSSRALVTLSRDAEASASAVEHLAEASEEIRTFVTLVQKLARQSKLLALNAAMEAARAGDHGHGFAVVAEEVRRLAATSSDAAEKTERVVHAVLTGVAQSRSSSERTVEMVRAVRDATEEGSRSFGNIEQTVADGEAFNAAIKRTVGAATSLSRDMRSKLDTLAVGTESFAAAMEEVAAASEEQSASTEQIAGAAATLTGAADRLTSVVANLRLDQHAAAAPAAPLRRSGPVRVPAGAGIGRPTPGRPMTKVK